MGLWTAGWATVQLKKGCSSPYVTAASSAGVGTCPLHSRIAPFLRHQQGSESPYKKGGNVHVQELGKAEDGAVVVVGDLDAVLQGIS